MSNYPVTLVCFAVKEEARAFQRLAGSAANVHILLTGMGERNARAAVAPVLGTIRPERVISAGFAGGLAPDLSRGTVVFFADVATGLIPDLLGVGARSIRFHCSERVVTTAAEKRAIYGRTGAEAVEMESSCIHALCGQLHIPAATVRIILDTASDDLALDFNELMTVDQRLNGRKLALSLLKSPKRIPALLRLQRQSAAAAQRLANVLARTVLQAGTSSSAG